MVVSVAVAAPAIGEPPTQPETRAVVRLEMAEEARAVYFAVGLDRPADMKVKWNWRELLSGAPALPHPAEIAEVYASPVWMCPCYFEQDQPAISERTRIPEILTFLGRCSPQPALDLQLR